MRPHEYQCPGQKHPISRSVHIARLLNAYAPCADCPHRDDRGTNSWRRRRQLGERFDTRLRASFTDTEGIAADYYNGFTATHAQRLGRAFGVFLNHQASVSLPRAVIGTDGGNLTPEVVAALCRGLRWSGTTAIESGPTTAPELVWQQRLLQARGAIYISQLQTPRHRVQIRLWQAGGCPLSSADGLDQLMSYLNTLDRPARQSAGRQRVAPPSEYLDALRPYFHALRPLNLVLKCDCQPFKAQFAQLLQYVACGLIMAGTGDELSRSVLQARAHFGAEIVHFGEGLRVVDEQGALVPSASLDHLVATACEPSRRHSGRSLRSPSPRTREQAYRSMVKEGVEVAIDGENRCWFQLGDHVLADGLRALALLMVALSRSDRALSRVVRELESVQNRASGV